jgi:hypothetical protein
MNGLDTHATIQPKLTFLLLWMPVAEGFRLDHSTRSILDVGWAFGIADLQSLIHYRENIITFCIESLSSLSNCRLH